MSLENIITEKLEQEKNWWVGSSPITHAFQEVLDRFHEIEKRIAKLETCMKDEAAPPLMNITDLIDGPVSQDVPPVNGDPFDVV